MKPKTAKAKEKGRNAVGQNKKKDVFLSVVVVMAALLAAACADPGIPPGMKVQMWNESPTLSDNKLALVIGEKEAIIEVLLKAESTWNAKNTETFLSHFSKDARIMFGREQKIISKVNFEKLFPAAFDEAGIIKYDKINIIGIKQGVAKVNAEVSISADGGNLVWLEYDIFLTKEETEWKIIDSVYSIHFKGVNDPRTVRRERGEVLLE